MGGVDLELHYHEVRRIVLSVAGTRATRAGIDPEDLVQYVALCIHRANLGPNPYDPERGTLSVYVGMHARCRLHEMLQIRWRQQEVPHSPEQIEADAPAAPAWYGHAETLYIEDVVCELVDEHGLDDDEADALRLCALGAGAREVWRVTGVHMFQLRDALRPGQCDDD